MSKLNRRDAHAVASLDRILILRSQITGRQATIANALISALERALRKMLNQ